VPVQEQFRGGEWRTNVVVPLRGIFLITVTLASYGDDDEDSAGDGQETEQSWGDRTIVIRIISARESTPSENALYFESRAAEMG
jgi:hypothetical protein